MLWYYSLPHSFIVHHYDSFAEFAQKVLRASIKDLEAICDSHEDAEALVLLREVTTNPVGKPKKDNTYIVSNNIEHHGNSKAYSLDKLKREPDLYEKVKTKNFSAKQSHDSSRISTEANYYTR